MNYRAHNEKRKSFRPSRAKEKAETINSSEKTECGICGKVFKGKKSLRDHISVVHEGNKPYECSICDKSFPKRVI